jgi:muramoyltetrapeptide carboxypeptidase LdcA involved in peptidoglycan recycling
MNIDVVCSPYLNVDSSNQQKAEIMNSYYLDDSIDVIFDISGGDEANGILDYLDYDMINKHYKPLFGYSDLTCVLNALYTKTNHINILYQVRNLLKDRERYKDFHQSIILKHNDLFEFSYQFIQGNQLEGIVLGGNIRCFLKLAGTSYFPDMTNKILLIESLGGKRELIYSHLVHLKQLGVFDKINGVLVGTFTTMENNNQSVIDLIKTFTNKPIIQTKYIGHNSNSKAVKIGDYYKFK